VESAERAWAIEKQRAEPDRSLNLLCTYCYYVSDAKIFFTFVPVKTQEEVLASVETLVADPRRGDLLDTAGLALIAFGETEADVREGIRLAEKAHREAGGDTPERHLADAFCQRHIALGQMRLDGRLRWWK
jgi:hypothetical protein